MIKVTFIKPDGDELLNRELTVEQIQVLNIVKRIEFNDEDNLSFYLHDMDYNVEQENLRVWLKESQ